MNTVTVQIVAPNGEGLRPLIRLTNNPSIKTRPFSYLLVWVIITVRSMFVQFCTFILNDRFCERLWRLLKEHRMTKTRKKVKTGRLYPIFSNDWNLEWLIFWDIGKSFSKSFQSTVLFWRFYRISMFRSLRYLIKSIISVERLSCSHP